MYFSNPAHRNFMLSIDAYYDSPVMEKMRSADGTSMYVCKVHSLLLKDEQFLIAMVPEDDRPMHAKVPLKELQWTCFQARTLDGEEHAYHHAVAHSYARKHEPHATMVQTSATKEYSVYRDEAGVLPIDLILLHTTANEHEYPPRGSFVSCMETYQTVLRWS